MTAYEYLKQAHEVFITSLEHYESDREFSNLTRMELTTFCQDFEVRLPFYSNEILAASSDLMDLTLLKLRLLKALLVDQPPFETLALMSCC